jgi:HEAT repeats/Putative zinc-finger
MQMNIGNYQLGSREPDKLASRQCEAAQRDIALAVYGELPDDASHRLEHHLAECGHCRRELEAVQGLRQAMSLYPMLDPSPNLLTRTRLRLEEALDVVPRSGWMTRIVDRFFSGIARVQSAPVMASGFLILGLSTGGVGGYRMGHKSVPPPTPPVQIAEGQDASQGGLQVASIESIQVLNHQPGSERVQIGYQRLVPETMTGSLDNPEIRELLLKGAENRVDPDIKANSLDVLIGACVAGRQCDDGRVRDTLMIALRRDKDPNVRLKALDGLKPYVAEDRNVRDVVLHALLKDSDSNVRMKAVDLLQPVDSDSSVRQALHNVADTDQNPYLRTVSRQVLSTLPEIQ